MGDTVVVIRAEIRKTEDKFGKGQENLQLSWKFGKDELCKRRGRTTSEVIKRTRYMVRKRNFPNCKEMWIIRMSKYLCLEKNKIKLYLWSL